MKGHQVPVVVCLALATALFAAACGGDDDGGGGGGGGPQSTGATKGAKTIDVASMDDAKGDVTYCTGKDTSGDLKEGIKDFNEQRNPGSRPSSSSSRSPPTSSATSSSSASGRSRATATSSSPT